VRVCVCVCVCIVWLDSSFLFDVLSHEVIKLKVVGNESPELRPTSDVYCRLQWGNQS
jgi:hypothetical protein